MISDPNDKMSKEEFIKEVDRTTKLLIECLELNNCMNGPAISAMSGIIMNDFLVQKFSWALVESYFKGVLDETKPFFEEKI